MVLRATSALGKVSVELAPPAQHLLTLACRQQPVEQQAVGEGPTTVFKVRLWCREEQCI